MRDDIVFFFLITPLIFIVVFLTAGLGYSFYHEVILMDTPCGAILGTPSNPPQYCDGEKFVGVYKNEWARPK